jgi:hypothetical protein
MVALPTIEDPTLAAVDRALEERRNAEPARPYLGMSIIGKECERELWLTFRWVGREVSDAVTLKRFEDGHRGEDLQAERLRLVPGLELHTHDPNTGGQFAVEDCGGHVKGHMDGAVLGIIQAPKTWHCWEHKQVGEKKQTELLRFKTKLGEKDALFAWNPVYYWQGQGYMGYTGMTRHYLTAASPGGRHTVSVRTDYDEAAFLRLRAKARRVVFGARPPMGISADPTFYKCKWCAFHAHCHEAKWPDAANCRTCLHATPEEDGTWSCARFAKTLSVDEQRQGCPAHLYIPDLIPAEQVDAGPDWVGYRLADGTEWRDGA